MRQVNERIIEISTSNHAEYIILPINPVSIPLNMAQKNQKIDLLEMGEILTLGNRALVSLSFSSFFPSEKSPHYHRADRPPWDYFNLLDSWRLNKQVVRLIIGGTNINLAMSIDKLSPELREGDNDLYYTISLEEYRRLNVPAIQHNQPRLQSGLLDRPDTMSRPPFHIVRVPGETLWHIACKYYGTGEKWVHIAKENNKVKVDDVKVGDKVVLP